MHYWTKLVIKIGILVHVTHFFNPRDTNDQTSKECHLQTGWPNGVKQVLLESLWKNRFNEAFKIKFRGRWKNDKNVG